MRGNTAGYMYVRSGLVTLQEASWHLELPSFKGHPQGLMILLEEAGVTCSGFLIAHFTQISPVIPVTQEGNRPVQACRLQA